MTSGSVKRHMHGAQRKWKNKQNTSTDETLTFNLAVIYFFSVFLSLAVSVLIHIVTATLKILRNAILRICSDSIIALLVFSFGGKSLNKISPYLPSSHFSLSVSGLWEVKGKKKINIQIIITICCFLHLTICRVSQLTSVAVKRAMGVCGLHLGLFGRSTDTHPDFLLDSCHCAWCLVLSWTTVASSHGP